MIALDFSQVGRILSVMRKASIACVALIVVFAGAGARSQRMSFEVASVKPGASSMPSGGGGTRIGAEQFDATWYPIQGLVSLAYGPTARVTGWPEWTRTARYDVRARTGRPAARQEVLAMLQTLLAERFALKAHRETRDMDIYALVVARSDATTGSKLLPVTVDCETNRLADSSGPGLFPRESRPACGHNIQSVTLAAGPQLTTTRYAAVTIERLAMGMSGSVGRPVVDKTGLAGLFDVELTYVRELPAGPFVAPATGRPVDGPSYRDALREQLGFELRPERGPVEFLVIDSIQPPTPD
jgi:uncharacterized protein (TIGR03435 family)